MHYENKKNNTSKQRLLTIINNCKKCPDIMIQNIGKMKTDVFVHHFKMTIKTFEIYNILKGDGKGSGLS